MVRDLNHHLVQERYENLLVVQGLTDHVTLFPTHMKGEAVDPVISDLLEVTHQCRQLGLVGSSDHHAFLTQVTFSVARDEVSSCTVWLCGQGGWGLHA